MPLKTILKFLAITGAITRVKSRAAKNKPRLASGSPMTFYS
jgi:hypothetical protein